MQLRQPTEFSLCFMTGLSYLPHMIRFACDSACFADYGDWRLAGSTCYNAGTDVPMCASTGAPRGVINQKD